MSEEESTSFVLKLGWDFWLSTWFLATGVISSSISPTSESGFLTAFVFVGLGLLVSLLVLLRIARAKSAKRSS